MPPRGGGCTFVGLPAPRPAMGPAIAWGCSRAGGGGGQGPGGGGGAVAAAVALAHGAAMRAPRRPGGGKAPRGGGGTGGGGGAGPAWRLLWSGKGVGAAEGGSWVGIGTT
jgi:hypothetical protein